MLGGRNFDKYLEELQQPSPLFVWMKSAFGTIALPPSVPTWGKTVLQTLGVLLAIGLIGVGVIFFPVLFLGAR